MSYAIIRNQNYKLKNLGGIYRHNERKNTNYSNTNINRKKSINNYSIKEPFSTYDKVFKTLKNEYNLKGQIKEVSNVMCEFIITSDKEFFEKIGESETKRYFETAYKFVANYKNLGEQYIVSAKVHMDESTPHLHLVFIPVIHKYDTKSGKNIDKIACSEYWKGKDSYKKLQDNFYNYMIKSGFDLERGHEHERKYLPVKQYKEITNFELQEMFRDSKKIEEKFESNDNITLKENYGKILYKYNTLAKRYTKIKNIVDKVYEENETLRNENAELLNELDTLEKEKNLLEITLEKTKYWIKGFTGFDMNKINRYLQQFYQNFK